jgi:site-specific DNA recombinase
MDITITTENQTLRNVAAGKYRNCYLVYSRKSTDEPDNQKNSIKYQRAENTKFAQREHLPIAPIAIKGFCVDGIISERHSGFKEDNAISITNAGVVQYRIERPKFMRLIQFLSKGSFRGIIVLCWDRVSRNRGDDTVVRKLMKNGVDIRFVYANYEKTSSGALHMDIDGMFAEHHSRVTAEKVRNVTRDLRDRGICTYKAPIGYLNQGTMEHKPFDAVRAPIVKEMYELAAKERSISDLAKWANEQGLTTLPIRRRRTEEEMLAEEEEDKAIERISRPITRAIVHRILTSPFYTGKIVDSNGRYIQSKSHEALVTEELFMKVQQALANRRMTVCYGEKLDLPHRGIVRCKECRRVYTPYIQKGTQYFYARCRPNCPNPHKSFNLRFFEAEVGKCLNSLSFIPEELAEIDAFDKKDVSTFENERLKRLAQNDRRIRKITEDLAYLHNNKLSLLKTGVYTPEGILEEEQRFYARNFGGHSQTFRTVKNWIQILLIC